MADWTNAYYADGRKVGRFCDEHGLTQRDHDSPEATAIRRWRRTGIKVPVERVDEVLTWGGFHLSELPDDVWLDCAPPDGETARDSGGSTVSSDSSETCLRGAEPSVVAA